MTTCTAKRRLSVSQFDIYLTKFGYATLKDFSEKSGMKLRTLHDLRSGKRSAGLDVIADLLDGFDNLVPFDQLFPRAQEQVDEYADLQLVAA